MIAALVGLALAGLWWGMMRVERFGAPFRAALGRVTGHTFEVLMYGAHPGVLLRAIGSLGRACFGLSLALLLPSLLFTPLLILGVSLVLATTAYRPFSVGDPVLVRLVAGGEDWSLRPDPGFRVEVERFRRPGTGELYWRLQPLKAGELALAFEGKGRVEGKSVFVGGGGLLNQARYPLGWRWLLSPWEAPLSGGLETVSVEYPAQRLLFAGQSWPWWAPTLLAFFLGSWLLALVAPGNGVRGRQNGGL